MLIKVLHRLDQIAKITNTRSRHMNNKAHSSQAQTDTFKTQNWARTKYVKYSWFLSGSG